MSYKGRINPQCPQYQRLSFSTSDFVILTENLLFVENIAQEQFTNLTPVDYVNNVYFNSNRCDWYKKKFQKRGPGRSHIIYILNDRYFYNGLMKNFAMNVFTELADKINGFDILQNPGDHQKKRKNTMTLLTDCVLCYDVCSIMHRLPEMKLMSTIWGICTDCNLKM